MRLRELQEEALGLQRHTQQQQQQQRQGEQQQQQRQILYCNHHDHKVVQSKPDQEQSTENTNNIDYNRLTSFLEKDNSFFTPWNTSKQQQQQGVQRMVFEPGSFFSYSSPFNYHVNTSSPTSHHNKEEPNA
ncbi:hypothetical protein Dsin_009946 [Dipteronia sinensis]|uniref:Uncharacterized protein n=1 Tax=Dipteronia sinensis TaxID=43782 RepID=A0AAE0EC76_9ROSI|nr:hypothetical protein Dsin_009946 [Dipteronia sinensis]